MVKTKHNNSINRSSVKTVNNDYVGNSKALKVVNRINVASIIVAALEFILSLILIFCLSTLEEAISQNGGMESLGSLLASSQDMDSTTSDSDQQIPDDMLDDMNSELSDIDMSQFIKSSGADYASILSSVFVFLYIYISLVSCFSIVYIVLSCLIINKINNKNKIKLVYFLNIWQIILSIILLNIILFVLSIISIVKLIWLKNEYNKS